MIVDCGVYVDGRRVDVEAPLADVLARAVSMGGFVWVGLHDPNDEEFEDIASAFGLHSLAVEDSMRPHQRPKLERYDDSVFVVLKPARYVDTEEVVEVDHLMVFVGEHFVVTVRHGPTASLAGVRDHLEGDPHRLRWGPTSVLHALADRVVDDYAVVMRGLDVDIDQIELEVFSAPKAAHAERIFKLKREVLDFRRAIAPLEEALVELGVGEPPIHADSSNYFRDVLDHLKRVSDSLEGLDALLDSALHANVAQVGMRQNEDMRKISAWVAIIAMPTMIAGIYGMNFEHMPELGWTGGYPLALSAMVVSCLALYRNFKRRGWL
ncbi:MAG: magnesium/cobalt transporter CorA [Ilumatobacter sp.]|uniref:magnesium/cobalt transporter CorA n=1 Tax=Ilumatobacter sp. TaxID=1967498 RepID=UPI0032984D98